MYVLFGIEPVMSDYMLFLISTSHYFHVGFLFIFSQIEIHRSIEKERSTDLVLSTNRRNSDIFNEENPWILCNLNQVARAFCTRIRHTSGNIFWTPNVRYKWLDCIRQIDNIEYWVSITPYKLCNICDDWIKLWPQWALSRYVM